MGIWPFQKNLHVARWGGKGALMGCTRRMIGPTGTLPLPTEDQTHTHTHTQVFCMAVNQLKWPAVDRAANNAFEMSTLLAPLNLHSDLMTPATLQQRLCTIPLQLDWPSETVTHKLICHETERATMNPKLRTESSR